MWGNLIVAAVVIAIAAIAIRFLWKSHKAGGHCNGNCASCGDCHKK